MAFLLHAHFSFLLSSAVDPLSQGEPKVRYPARSLLHSIPLVAQDPWIFYPIRSSAPGFRTMFLCSAGG